MDDTEDTEIIRRVLAGEQNCFSVIVQRYQFRVGRIAATHVPAALVEEVSQDIFLEVFRSLKNFSRRSPFEHWLAKIAVRCCYAYWRKEKRERQYRAEQPAAAHYLWLDKCMNEKVRVDHDDLCRKREAREILNYCLMDLSAEDQMVLTLVHLEGYSTREAAEFLGWSKANVKVRCWRARKLLKHAVEKLLNERE